MLRAAFARLRISSDMNRDADGSGRVQPHSVMIHYCTAFDLNYLVRGLTLRRSLLQHSAPFTLWVLCHDEASLRLLEALDFEDVRPVSVSDLEARDPELAATRRDRTRIEYYFTCTPSWQQYLLEREQGIESVTYLDADLMFYSSVRPIHEEMRDASIVITPHRFAEKDRWREQFGIYNVGYMTFRNDRAARDCLDWWRGRCLEWCHDRVEPGRFGDQKYLDDWPERFAGVTVLHNRAAGVGPWNWMDSGLRLEDDMPRVDGIPLIFYHFHGLRVFSRRLYDTGLPLRPRMPRPLRRWLYDGYVRELRKTAAWIRGIAPSHAISAGDRQHLRHSPAGVGKLVLRSLAGRLL
jgi:hypothetical protein